MQYRACLPLIAEWKEDTSSGSTYVAESGKAIGKLMTVAIAQERETVTAYADNGLVEEIKIFKDATITLGTTFVPEDCESLMFGNTYVAASSTASTPASLTDNESDDGKYTGFGFVVGDRENGADVYRLYWLYKVHWTQPDDDFETKGESVSFKNPSITGTAYPNANGDWRIRKTYSDEKAAIDALKELAEFA